MDFDKPSLRSPIAAAAALLAIGLLVTPAAQADEVGQLLVPNPTKAVVTLDATPSEEVLRRVEIERGKSIVLRSPFTVKRVSVGDPSIADVVVLSPREVQLVGKKVGDTNVIVWNTRGGLQAAIDLHVGAPHSGIQNELARLLENDSIRVDGAGHSVVLKGTVASPIEMDRALQVASAFFGGGDDDQTPVINMLDVGGNQQVMIEVVVAEMSRSLRRNLGTNFAGVTNGDTDFSIFSFLNNLTSLDDAGDMILLSKRVNLAASIANGSDSLDIFMEAIQERGLAKVLAEPTLTARTGEPARFLAGGEVPIPIPQSGLSNTITIEFKEFGVGVVFTPTVLGQDRIHLEVAAEVSEPDPTFGVQLEGFTVPGFLTRRSATGIELGDGQSFAIAGLLSEKLSELATEFPGFGDIPVIGALFRSTEFEKQQTELVMIVTPRLVKPLPPGPHTLPTDHFIEPNAAEFFLLGSLEGGVLGRMFPDESTQTAAFDESVSPAEEALNDGVAGDAGHRVDVTRAEEGW